MPCSAQKCARREGSWRRRAICLAFARAEQAAGRPLPMSRTAFLSVRDEDKLALVPIAARLAEVGVPNIPRPETSDVILAAAGLPVQRIGERLDEDSMDKEDVVSTSFAMATAISS